MLLRCEIFLVVAVVVDVGNHSKTKSKLKQERLSNSISSKQCKNFQKALLNQAEKQSADFIIPPIKE